MQYTVAMQSCRSFALWGPAVQYAVAMQSYRRLICPDFVCLMDGGCSVYCGQSCRLIALCGPAVQYTVASLVV